MNTRWRAAEGFPKLGERLDLSGAGRGRVPARRGDVPGHRPRVATRQDATRGRDRRLARLRATHRPRRRRAHR
jgi:hypothetical protein